GHILCLQKRFDEAEGVLRQAVAHDERSLGSNHPGLAPDLLNLGVALVGHGRSAEGEHLVHRALEITQAAYGSDHPDVAQILSSLAQIQHGLGKPEAHDTARRALEALSKSMGPDHPITQEVAPRLQQVIADANGAPSAMTALTAQIYEGQVAL